MTVIAFTLSVWMHGAWYLWPLLPAAFFCARRWRDGLWLGLSWVMGTLLGACLTGRPWAFLHGGVFMALAVFHEHAPKWMLVGEFQPSTGEFSTLTLLALVWLARAFQTHPPALLRQPVFWLIILGWILGFEADRFWADWGLPAALVWMALQFDEILSHSFKAGELRRLGLCVLVCAPLYLDATNDLQRRYSYSLEENFLDASDPALAGWFPKEDGIFYADGMRFFYNTFYANPTGQWRYILGFEPALMPEADLKILRAIQRNHAASAYMLWVDKMQSKDRLVVDAAAHPDLPGLEWKRAGGVWIGRKLPAP